MLHSGGKSGIDDILRTVDIGLDALFGIILRRIDLLYGRGVDDHVNALTGADKTLPVADISYKESELRIFVMRIFLFEFVLFEFIARINHYPLHIGITAQNNLYEFFTERACTARYEY